MVRPILWHHIFFENVSTAFEFLCYHPNWLWTLLHQLPSMHIVTAHYKVLFLISVVHLFSMKIISTTFFIIFNYYKSMPCTVIDSFSYDVWVWNTFTNIFWFVQIQFSYEQRKTTVRPKCIVLRIHRTQN